MSFVAKYSGTCGRDCGDPIVPGDEVEYVPEYELVHADCEAEASLTRVTETCTDCFIQKPCPCEDDQ